MEHPTPKYGGRIVADKAEFDTSKLKSVSIAFPKEQLDSIAFLEALTGGDRSKWVRFFVGMGLKPLQQTIIDMILPPAKRDAEFFECLRQIDWAASPMADVVPIGQEIKAVLDSSVSSYDIGPDHMALKGHLHLVTGLVDRDKLTSTGWYSYEATLHANWELVISLKVTLRYPACPLTAQECDLEPNTASDAQ